MSQLAHLPSVDRLLQAPGTQALVDEYGRTAVVAALRASLEAARTRLREGITPVAPDAARLEADCRERLQAAQRPSLRPVFNLTGTVLHTNLGRALLPQAAVAALEAVAAQPANVEYELSTARRGDRDAHVESLLQELTGAEAATVVNNNAAAVLLVLNTLALGKEVPVSRGELIEIGGSFRMPDIMARAGCSLREVGTTNRTHLKDYAGAIAAETGMVMKVHTSNYRVEGFTATVEERALAALASERGVPFAVDLGAGSLVDLEAWGLPHEPTPRETLAAGADLVTFSGDKLLGGPQAGLIVGRAGLVEALKRNPLKRALRLDKLRLAALEAVLRLYRNPERLGATVPTLRHLTRPLAEIEARAERVLPALRAKLGAHTHCELKPCQSQIGSGSLPVERLPSVCIAITAAGAASGPGDFPQRLARAFRALSIPVIGRIRDGALCFDLRCLDDEQGFIDQLCALTPEQWA